MLVVAGRQDGPMAFAWPSWRRDLAAASVGFAIGSTLLCGGFVGAFRWHQAAAERRRNDEEVLRRLEDLRLDPGLPGVPDPPKDEPQPPPPVTPPVGSPP
jgi:hypothetical protein